MPLKEPFVLAFLRTSCIMLGAQLDVIQLIFYIKNKNKLLFIAHIGKLIAIFVNCMRMQYPLCIKNEINNRDDSQYYIMLSA